MPDSCDVLLATFNGAPFLAEQLDSLLAQDRDDFRVLARDDGSTDGTADILADYLPKFGGRMTILPTENGSGSATANFGILMAASDAERLLFCDQDDVWGPRKVGLTLDLLDAAVAERGPDVPALVFTDVTPVDAALRPLGDSFWAYKKVRPEVSADLRASLVCGTLLGCAMAVNRATAARALPFPSDQIPGHDWWMQLIACGLGTVRYSAERTMRYRLHGGNASGQKPVSTLAYATASGRAARVRRGMSRRYDQAAALLTRLDDELPAEARQTVEAFLATRDLGPVTKRWKLWSGRFLYPDWQRNLAMLALV